MPALTESGASQERARNVFLRPLDLVLVLALVGAGSWSSVRLFSAPTGSRAVFWVDGHRVAWVPLEGPLAVDSVRGALGTFAVEHGEGRVRVLRAPCPGRICLKQGNVRRVGEKLVCVPSRVVVVVESASGRQGDLDAVP